MPTSRVIMILYAFSATVYVMATAHGPASLAWATAPVLMPLLAGAVIFAAAESGRSPDRWMLAALVLATLADVAFLALPPLGIAFLVASQAVYAITFARARWIGIGVGVLLLSDGLFAVRLIGAFDLPSPAVLVAAAYTFGQALIVIGWVRRPAITTPPVSEPRTEEEVLTRQ